MIDDFYSVTTPPAEEPVTLQEAKDWLRVRNTADDTLITSLIEGARRFGEKFCNRVFVEREIECHFSSVDFSSCEPYPFIQVRRAPLISVDTFEVYLTDTFAAFTDYEVKEVNGFSRLIFQNEVTYDALIPYPIKVGITAGYGAASDVPEDIKTAIKAHVAFLYENRGDVVAEGKLSMPLETRSIYSGKYRILNTYG